jgi:hypothetical protein
VTTAAPAPATPTATPIDAPTRPSARPRTVVGALWLFATLNFLYCDLVGLMNPPDLAGFLAGEIGGIRVTESFLLAASVLMQVPMSTVLVVRVAPWRVARVWAIAAAVVMTLVHAGTFFMGSGVTSFYAMFSVTEIGAVLVAAWVAWRHRVEPA